MNGETAEFIVEAKIDRSKAVNILGQKPTPLSRKRKIIKAELLCLPCYVFQVYVENEKGNVRDEKICVDGIQGQFAFFKGEKFSNPAQDSKIFNFCLSENEAKQIALHEYKRLLLKQSLKSRNSVAVKSIKFDKKIHYPYWIGYFQRKSALDFDAIDGVNGERQGVKMRPIFIDLLLQK